MKKSNVLIYEISELRDILKKFYSDILKDTVTEIIEVGGCIIPSIIFEKGIDKLMIEELIDVACPWAEMQMDMNEDCDGIIMIDGSETSHLLTPDVAIDMTIQDNKINLKKPKNKKAE
jgi:hypothetical protein